MVIGRTDLTIGRFDVAVIGGGPAGAIAGWALARGGVRVAIVDGSHPREKPCGGGVTARALSLVGEALQDAAIERVAISSARFEDAAGASAAVPLPTREYPAMIAAARSAFDGALLDAACRAGATLVPARALDVALADGKISVTTRAGHLSADRVIGADGANSLVRRRVARPFRRDQLTLTTGYYAHGVRSREIIIRLISEPPGYLWSFPRPDHLAIGICAQADTAQVRPLRHLCAAWMRASRIAPGARLQAYSWPIPSLRPADFDTERPADSRWLLTGDAAGLVDPMTREGIYFALLSGLWSADAMLCADGPKRYAARLRDEIYPELRRAARLKTGFFEAWFTPLVIDALTQSEAIRHVIADFVAGAQPYRGLRRRLFSTFEFGLAAKCATSAIRARYTRRERARGLQGASL